MDCPGVADMSDVFEWNPAYSVNIGSIDAQHRSLLAIGRELLSAFVHRSKQGLDVQNYGIAWCNTPPRTSRTRNG